MDEKLLTLNEITKIVGFKKSTIYKFIKNKDFPKPIKIGKSSRWPLSAITKWINHYKEQSMI
jgi:prophage regulatory protein